MKKRTIIKIFFAVLLTALLLTCIVAANSNDEIVILYENDVHCAVEGYTKLAAMKHELSETYDHVGVVSSGDFIQGTSLGVISRGAYIIELMNLVGYDAVALGNHEFDYHLPRLEELAGMMDTAPICCNFQKVGEKTAYFEPYSIVSYGKTDIAYIGITTPSTMVTTSSPKQFFDEQGNELYTFHGSDLYAVVQQTIDSAKEAGADYVIALSHIGDQEEPYDVAGLIESTSGLDVVLDAHSHSVIEMKVLTDADGREVVLSSTGTAFANIGKLTISKDSITTELIGTEEYEKTDAAVDAYLLQINEEFAALGGRKIAVSEVDLITHDANGNRIIRTSETNLGNLVSDAFRTVMDADIGYINGGGLRSAVDAGDVTFNDILNILPFNNQPVVVETSGQNIKDMLELTLRDWPGENGSFPHVSGMIFSVDPSVPSSVRVDENEMFVAVDGPYRVSDIEVFNKETQTYEPLDEEKLYTLVGENHHLLEYGGGMIMFKDAAVIKNDGTLDVEVVETYLTEHLGGVIGQEYANPQNRIRFIESDDIGKAA